MKPSENDKLWKAHTKHRDAYNAFANGQKDVTLETLAAVGSILEYLDSQAQPTGGGGEGREEAERIVAKFEIDAGWLRPEDRLWDNFERESLVGRIAVALRAKAEPKRAAVAGEYTTVSIRELARRCEILLAEEQEKPLPDNTLVACLCDCVRMTREFERWPPGAPLIQAEPAPSPSAEDDEAGARAMYEFAKATPGTNPPEAAGQIPSYDGLDAYGKAWMIAAYTFATEEARRDERETLRGLMAQKLREATEAESALATAQQDLDLESLRQIRMVVESANRTDGLAVLPRDIALQLIDMAADSLEPCVVPVPSPRHPEARTVVYLRDGTKVLAQRNAKGCPFLLVEPQRDIRPAKVKPSEGGG